jgi:hypothetical protein
MTKRCQKTALRNFLRLQGNSKVYLCAITTAVRIWEREWYCDW